jgi:putative hydrolase of the HAD superfamily
MINWVIFDAMGVVFTVGDDTNDLLVPFVQERNRDISSDVVNAAYHRASLGNISSCQFWGEVGLGDRYPAVEFEYLDSMLTIDDAFIPVANALSARYRLGLLSNDVSEWSKWLRRKFALNFFDCVVISGDVQARKPDASIYERFLQECQVSADTCVFIDDRHKNLSAAQAVGMRTIHFAREAEAGGFVPDARIGRFAELETAIKNICQSDSRGFFSPGLHTTWHAGPHQAVPKE